MIDYSMPEAEAEAWKPIPGYEGIYEVSDHGRVRSLDHIGRFRDSTRLNRGRVLRPDSKRYGHQYVNLSRDRKQTKAYVHRLVLMAFVGPAPAGMEACHNDGDPSNNHLTNLRWDTHSENNRDQVRHGTHPFATRTVCPRGHELISPNLTRCIAAKGYRGCLACSRAQSWAKHRGRPLTKEVADAYYAEIMEGAK